ncbi:hypothetical protein EC957_005736 [Mortierella hygrophila]|uniref:Uncharacterized protein n=1 Tax=Mortierella hygrophila TaxID=979708 RepID=A0A9P6F0K6_9FUNG|nr:hypothetical protein EC957_005736 [Mortierella hygrophila]
MSFPPRFIRTQTPHALQSILEQDSIDCQLHNSNNSDNLFQDLDNNDNNNNNNSENDNEERDEGREQSDSIINLSQPSSLPTSLPRFAFLSAPTTTQGDSFALLADKTSKRVRVSSSKSMSRSRSTTPILLDVDDSDYKPATSSPTKRVRFDESKNRVHWHHRSSSVSPPGSPIPTINLKAQPLASALLHRSQYGGNQSPSASFDFDESFTSVSSSTSGNGSAGNQSPEKFSLSLENTSQDVMDFASSLTRLMGSGNLGGSQESDSSSTTGTSFAAFNSPLPMSASSRIFSNMFQASPPSPVRPSFMSYSPPPSSSLSSCWSPTIDDDEDDSMKTAPRISPPPPPVSVQKARAPFVPRRPRNAGNLSPTRPGAVPGAPRRFPSMLKREASNASFLDNYPASLAPGPGDDDYNPSPSSVSRVFPSPPAAVPVVPRIPTPPREASANPALQSVASSIIPAVSLPLMLAGAAASTPLLRKSLSDIPLRSLKNRSNINFSNSHSDTQKIVPQFKKSASFNEFMDTCSNNNNNNNNIHKNLSQEDVIMSLAPLFPLQSSIDSQLI